jgi:hypothetical protein
MINLVPGWTNGAGLDAANSGGHELYKLLKIPLRQKSFATNRMAHKVKSITPEDYRRIGPLAVRLGLGAHPPP